MLSGRLSLFATLLLLTTAACHHDDRKTYSNTLSVSPASATVETGSIHQFIANETHANLSWQVNNIPGGDRKVGAITSSGVYFAPDSVPNPSVVTVAAVANYNGKVHTASSIVTIVQHVIVMVSPRSAVVAPGETRQFEVRVATPPRTLRLLGKFRR